MAITTAARWRAREVVTDRRADRREGIADAVASLRSFAEVEPDPTGQRALLKAAAALAEVHGISSGE